MKIYRLLLLLLLGMPCFGQTHTFPALDTNNTFTGSNTFGQLNGFFYVENPPFSGGCPAAITAAGTVNGTEVIIPGTGPIVDCPVTAPENVIIQNFDMTREWCNGSVGGATPPCFAINYGRDDSNVSSRIRMESTSKHQDAAGVETTLYVIGNAKNAVANSLSSFDGTSWEMNSSGTASGVFGGLAATEIDSTANAVGGTYNNQLAINAYVNIGASSTTAIVNGASAFLQGCHANTGGTNWQNCYDVILSDQTGKTAGRNYTFDSKGLGLFEWSGTAIKGGFDCENKAHTALPCFFIDNSTNGTVNIQAVSVDGINVLTSGGATFVTYVPNFAKFGVNVTCTVAGGCALGTTSLPWSNVVIGGALNNSANFTGTFTANRTVTVPDGNSAPVMPANLTTTAAASDNVTVTGMTSSGHCTFSPTNASAATNIATTFISAKAANQITVSHAVTGSMTYDILCTSN